ncbi:unnamed protein product [Phytophthora lilii]|uniref:Unnamed protein product n=1 Tax=Phytophthora lilii TaxID=2077276 RepID=A0A9W6WRZ1_9STRA|nr:unnamed protein product [Phytophthora lilii]
MERYRDSSMEPERARPDVPGPKSHVTLGIAATPEAIPPKLEFPSENGSVVAAPANRGLPLPFVAQGRVSGKTLREAASTSFSFCNLRRTTKTASTTGSANSFQTMKTYAAIAASALIVATTMDSATAMKSYLEEIPNGSVFSQDLGHPDKDSSQFTKFGTAFGAADHTWTAEFCKATFPGASMTNGEAFGDPCCTWKKGGKPDFTVAAFTTTPGEATKCASGGGGSAATPSSAAGSSAETPSAETPSAETPSAETPETEDYGTTATGGGCAAKGAATKR